MKIGDYLSVATWLGQGATFGLLGYFVFRAMGGPSHASSDAEQIVACVTIGMSMYAAWRLACEAFVGDEG